MTRAQCLWCRQNPPTRTAYEAATGITGTACDGCVGRLALMPKRSMAEELDNYGKVAASAYDGLAADTYYGKFETNRGWDSVGYRSDGTVHTGACRDGECEGCYITITLKPPQEPTATTTYADLAEKEIRARQAGRTEALDAPVAPSIMEQAAAAALQACLEIAVKSDPDVIYKNARAIEAASEGTRAYDQARRELAQAVVAWMERGVTATEQAKAPAPRAKCECGSSLLRLPEHSAWCPAK